ncbi:hypothetical protein Tco_0102115, partial [Tanacetum coccineum]
MAGGRRRRREAGGGEAAGIFGMEDESILYS